MATPKLKTKEEDTDEEQIEDEEEAEQEEADEEESNEKEIEVETESNEDEDEDEEEEVVTEEVELPEDEDEEEETTSKGSLLSGSTFGVSNKVLLGIGLAAIVLVLILRTSEANSSTRDYSGGDEQVEEEIESGTEGAIEQQPTDAGGSATKFSQQAQDDAINSVFG